ncbi:Sialic acid synthase [Nymphon striatum]|nr:Sialic acid synthase [Nymphon striatum]
MRLLATSFILQLRLIMNEITLSNGRKIGAHNPCYIVAEIGQNHQGDIEIAKKLVKVAKDCHVDCVKFQKSDLEEKFNKAALSQPYYNENSWGCTYGEHKKYLEFNEEEYHELQRYATELGIDFSASGMDMKSVDFLDSMNVPFLKVASNDVNSLQYLAHAASKGRPMFVSSGMQTLETMKDAYNLLKSKNIPFCFLQCTSSYPTHPSDVHLQVIKTYQKHFPDIPIGYSGHELGISISIAAVALGTKVLERHITLDKNWKGSDHKCSLDPSELKELVAQVKIVENALGSPEKLFRDCEMATYLKLGKTIVAREKLEKGKILSQDNICSKVADSKGIKSEHMKDILGRKLAKNVDRDDNIFYEDLI